MIAAMVNGQTPNAAEIESGSPRITVVHRKTFPTFDLRSVAHPGQENRSRNSAHLITRPHRGHLCLVGTLSLMQPNASLSGRPRCRFAISARHDDSRTAPGGC